MNKIFTTLLSLVLCLGVNAQEATPVQKNDSIVKTIESPIQKKNPLLFKHLAIGGQVGTTGFGFEVATSLTPHFAIRAGFQAFGSGTLKVKLPVTNGDIHDALDIDDPNMNEATRRDKVRLDLKFKMLTGNILVDFYPWKQKSFHVTAGMFFGNRTMLHIYNPNEGELKFLYESNNRVQIFNELFGTQYQDIGLKFGDYVFTADENGNMDAKIKVWAVRPYIGVGWGRNVSLSVKRKVNFNFDVGTQFWGAPKCVLNHEKTISSRSKEEGGVFKLISGFIFWPSLRFTVSGDIF